MEGSHHDRYRSVARVLIHVLWMNLVVAVAKIVFGYASGAISVLSDGFHSLTDAASNVVGLVGVRAAKQPPTPIIHTDTVSTKRLPPPRSRSSCCWWSSRCCATRSTASAVESRRTTSRS